jgi:hypothetical protein
MRQRRPTKTTLAKMQQASGTLSLLPASRVVGGYAWRQCGRTIMVYFIRFVSLNHHSVLPDCRSSIPCLPVNASRVLPGIAPTPRGLFRFS